jgi:hypothetical protein
VRPTYLPHLVLARVVLALLPLPLVGTGALPRPQALAIEVPFLAAELFVFWSLWQGKNWARVVTIALSLLTVSALEFLPGASTLYSVLLTVDAAFSAFLVYWLFRPEARRYFKRDPQAA